MMAILALLQLFFTQTICKIPDKKQFESVGFSFYKTSFI